ncbi:MAG: hypothetical protein WCR54_00600 [Clostridia bacterium]
MKYCNKCGKEIENEAVVCPFCGCQVAEMQVEESSTMGILSIVFGALGGWLGLVLGIIGLTKYKIAKNRKNCKIGIGLFCAWVVGYIIIIVSMVSAAASMY